jgi:hypothetical protein
MLTPHKIFSYIATPKVYNGRETRRPAEKDDIHSFDFIRGIGQNNFGYAFRSWPRPSDMALRLVSKAFCRAMTRAYFNHEFAILRGGNAGTVSKVQEHILNNQRPLAPAIKRLQIE